MLNLHFALLTSCTHLRQLVSFKFNMFVLRFRFVLYATFFVKCHWQPSFSAVLLNKTRIYNKDRLEELVENRPKDHPLLTISNHHSCFDDPGIFGCLKLRNVASSQRIRWSLAAYDICFTNRLHATFFMFGKCIPVIRGGGVYQPAVDLCIQKLKLGEWVSSKKNLIHQLVPLKFFYFRSTFSQKVK